MQRKRLYVGLNVALALFVVGFIASPRSSAQDTVLYPFETMFKTPPDGNYPYASLIFDSAGNLYGTTWQGGNYTYCSPGCGIVFELSPPAAGGAFWVESILYTFGATSTDGQFPLAGLIFDKAGNLYGTTQAGGTYGYGRVYELVNPGTAGGAWNEKPLHDFNFTNPGEDGYGPVAGLVFDPNGNLYGTTNQGGKYDLGTVFELRKPAGAGGAWKERILHNFINNGKDGQSPAAGLIFDSATPGNLYGTTSYGGAGACTLGCGTVYELINPGTAGGAWAESMVHDFSDNGKDGTNPAAGLIFDSNGNLYGTTFGGGKHNVGMVFELSPPPSSGAPWPEQILHVFDDNGIDGTYPEASLILDDTGTYLYGTTFSGGDGTSCSGGCGTVFKLNVTGTPYGIRSAFTSPTTEGSYPHSGLVFGADGNLYGTTTAGGGQLCDDCGYGTVFEIAP